jgi:hypothetical protein
MKILEIQDGDKVIVTMDIGNIPPSEVDVYIKKPLKHLGELFGCEVFLLPVRGGGWDFTIIRNPNRKKENSYANTSRKRTHSHRDR